MSTHAACAIRVTVFSTEGKFRPVSNFTELQAPTLAACSYVLMRISQAVACKVFVTDSRVP